MNRLHIALDMAFLESKTGNTCCLVNLLPVPENKEAVFVSFVDFEVTKGIALITPKPGGRFSVSTYEKDDQHPDEPIVVEGMEAVIAIVEQENKRK